ncbi:kinase family protein [Lichtheimia corymbifera JMRC:FSU:9682]|uniref:Kinase family protein n=1 Tax=Lichtheimia corymbifera JMRC:FSU:9682 TaxID=1263082 RepID=A0A068S2F1_9FUNG|nr:kinase family protein [Lichtheimia corymbifera JMRC:FSU:9682]
MLSTDTSNNEQQPSSSSSDGNGSNRSNGTDQAPEKFTAPAITTVSTTSTLSPDPILVTRSSSGGHHRGHSHSKRSIGSAAEILSSLKITTSGHHHEHSTPTSPIPSSLDSHVISGNMDDFTIKAPIGYGSSAVVYSAVYTPLNLRVASKMIDLDKFERNQIDELRRETTLMALSKHPNVLRVLGSFVHGSKLYIVTPYLAGGSCLDIMKTQFSEGLDELSIATILKQALEGLLYLHKNDHIHRDVKAGNLLMDEHGTVMLADFGVSSSLMDTGGERGVRKTFVGTPCWMAPEVMEQAGYDYKADIWSFGITAIELATGHAPFAKLPPLKVLMMTLSSDPPTLVRETTKHKYSRVFKDMVDSCLNKDPSKRPTAEKLLQHPFFKQAKRRDYLVKTLLSDLPPLEQRPHKKIPQRQLSITKTDEWDFHDTPEEKDSTTVPETSQPASSQQQPKRHISFGDVVVRNPPQAFSTSSNQQTQQTTAAAEIIVPQKKSRFVVEEISEDGSVHTLPPVQGENLTSTPPSISRDSSLSDNAMLQVPTTTTTVAGDDDQEIKRGRFSVKQGGGGSEYPTVSSVESAVSSSDPAAGDRRSRFEIQLGDNNNTPIITTGATSTTTSHSLSRANSVSSSSNGISLTRDGSTHSRVAKYPMASTFDDQQGVESRKMIGRFELTTSEAIVRPPMSHSSSDKGPEGIQESSPSSSVSGQSSSTSPSASLLRGQGMRDVVSRALPTNLQSQLEELVKVNESQRHMLQELSGMIHAAAAASKTTPATRQHSSSLSISESFSESSDKMESTAALEAQLQNSVRANQALQRENEILRKEIEQLKLSSSNTR